MGAAGLRLPVPPCAGLGILFLMSSEILSRVQSSRDAGDSDEAIVRRVQEGETELYEVLVRRYNRRVYRVARAVLRDDAGVEDVMQEAYLRAFTALPRFQGRAQFSTWLTRIVINCALAHRRRQSRRAEIDLESVPEPAARGGTGDHGGDAGLSAEELGILQKQVGRLIEKTLESLPPSYRTVFVLREMEEMSISETAACLGISPVNARVRLHRARKLMKEGLRRQMPDIGLYAFLGERCDTLTARVMTQVNQIAQRQAFPSLSAP